MEQPKSLGIQGFYVASAEKAEALPGLAEGLLSEGSRTRTYNQRIKSPMLYQLSYAPGIYGDAS